MIIVSEIVIAWSQANDFAARLNLAVNQSGLELQILGRVAHKEVFTLLRPEDGPYKDHEWDDRKSVV